MTNNRKSGGHVLDRVSAEKLELVQVDVVLKQEDDVQVDVTTQQVRTEMRRQIVCQELEQNVTHNYK